MQRESAIAELIVDDYQMLVHEYKRCSIQIQQVVQASVYKKIKRKYYWSMSIREIYLHNNVHGPYDFGSVDYYDETTVLLNTDEDSRRLIDSFHFLSRFLLQHKTNKFNCVV